MYVCVRACARARVCVCVRERDRETETERQRDRGRKRETVFGVLETSGKGKIQIIFWFMGIGREGILTLGSIIKSWRKDLENTNLNEPERLKLVR